MKVLFAVALWMVLQSSQGCLLPYVENAWVSTSTNPVGGRYLPRTMMYIRCKDGYVLVGKDSMECNHYNNWDGEMPKCISGNSGHKSVKYCNHPKNFFGGKFYPYKENYKYDDKVYYACPGNYVKYTYSVCGKDGRWDQASKCYGYCKPPKMDYGYHEPKKEQYYYGEAIKYRCNDKYYEHYEGEKYEMTKCGEDGNWDRKKPMCKKYCEAPDHKMYYHQSYAKKMYMYGEKMYYYCMDEYYRPDGYSYNMATCMSGGKWDKTPYKCEKRCTSPDYSDYHHKPYAKKVYKSGEYMKYMCKDGYYKHSQYDYDRSMCKSDGNWDKSPYKCMKYCRGHEIPYGRYFQEKDMYKYMDRISYKCDDGYMMVYKDEKYEYNECDKDGNWKRMAPMCKKYCKPPTFDHASYRPMKQYYNKGDRMYYGCKEGYELRYGKDWYEYNTCDDNGKWRFMEPSCYKVVQSFCGKPRMEYGMVMPEKSSYFQGEKVSYKCKDGYKLFYDNDWFEYSTCMKGGKWDFKPPMCRKKEMNYCKQPYFGHGSMVPSMKKYSYGERIYFKCHDGYKLFYEKDWFEYATCKKDGNWDFEAPKCRPMAMKYCKPEELMHGDYFPKMKMYMEGDRMYYKCKMGYKLFYPEDWYEYRTCGKDGHWDYKPALCKKTHQSKAFCLGYELKHGKRRPNKFVYGHGEKVYYDCDEGYEKYYDDDHDYEYSTCNSEGMWDRRAPMCKSSYKNYCHPPRMMHGSYYPMMKMYNSGDRLRFRCSYGYEMQFSGDRYEYTTCGRDGNWDKHAPMCKSNKFDYCDAPKFDHGVYKPMMKKYNPGDRLYYKCKEGYQLKYGKDWFEYNKCQDNGRWMYMHPMCKLASKAFCDKPRFDHGVYNPGKQWYAYGERISYKCNSGYEMYYENDWYEYATCKTGGYWDYKPPMCKKMMKYCYPPEYHHGYYYPMMRKYTDGARMYYRCHNGYKKVYHGDAYEYNTCMDGKWKYESPKCMDMRKKYCKPPKYEYGSYSPMKKMYEYGDRIRYNCNDGYYKHYDGDYYEYATCKQNGMWDKKHPTCKKRQGGYCMPKRIMHGDYFPKKERYSFGNRISYSCKSGYGMRYQGSPYQYTMCKRDGKWDYDAPMCVRIGKVFCSVPYVEHSSVYWPKMKYYDEGDRIYINCKPGYYKYYSGYNREYSTCRRDGQWDNLPKCKMMAKKYCKAPMYSSYHHKSYSKSQYMVGEWMKYECKAGYYAPAGTKYTHAECMSNGKWNNQPYKCMKYCMGESVRYGSYTPMKKYYKPGDKVYYKCNNDYIMKYHGSQYQYMTCKHDGTWDNKAPMCKKNCYAPFPYQNGYYYPRKYAFEYGQKITVYCNRGYRLKTQINYSVCGDNGKWKLSIPYCLRY